MKRGIVLSMIFLLVLTMVMSVQAVPLQPTQSQSATITYSEQLDGTNTGFKLATNNPESSIFFIKDKSVKEILIIASGGGNVFYGEEGDYDDVSAQEQNTDARGKDVSSANKLFASVGILGRNYLISEIPQMEKLFTSTAAPATGIGYKIFTRGEKVRPIRLVINGENINTDELYFWAGTTQKIFYTDESRTLRDAGFIDTLQITFLPSEINYNTCTDTDVGLDPRTKGTVTGTYLSKEKLTGDWTDYCSNNNELVEYKCDKQKVRFNVIVCPNGCSDGACIQPPYCLDKDGSLQYATLPIRYDQYVTSSLQIWSKGPQWTLIPEQVLLTEPALSIEEIGELQGPADLTEYIQTTASELQRQKALIIINDPIFDTCKDENTVAELQCKNDPQQPYEVIDLPCGEGHTCDGGKCVLQLVTAECIIDAECADGYQCLEGICVAQEKPFGCFNDAECEEGYECFKGTCVVKLECRTDVDCLAGQVCENNECKDSTNDYDFDSRIKRLAALLKRVEALEKVNWEEKPTDDGTSTDGKTWGGKIVDAITKIFRPLTNNPSVPDQGELGLDDDVVGILPEYGGKKEADIIWSERTGSNAAQDAIEDLTHTGGSDLGDIISNPDVTQDLTQDATQDVTTNVDTNTQTNTKPIFNFNF